jgi:hypothetical protein
VASRRVLREDPDFDAIVAAAYEHAGDYDLKENAFSTGVAEWRKDKDREEKEKEREAKRRRKEQAAAVREQYIREQEEAARKAVAAAAEAAAARPPPAAAEEVVAADDADDEWGEPVAAVAAAKTPKAAPKSASKKEKASAEKKPGPGRPKSAVPAAAAAAAASKATASKAAASKAAAAAAATPPPVARAKPTAALKPGAVVEMPDDFAGLYEVRVLDDNHRFETRAWPASDAPTPSDPDAIAFELRRANTAESVRPLETPFARVPATATVTLARKIVATQCDVPEKKVFIVKGASADDVDWGRGLSELAAHGSTKLVDVATEGVILYAVV